MSRFDKYNKLRNKTSKAPNAHNEFYTPKWLVEFHIDTLEREGFCKPGDKILCNADNSNSWYVKVLKERGYWVEHLFDYYWDFHDISKFKDDWKIITNPPFSHGTSAMRYMVNNGMRFSVLGNPIHALSTNDLTKRSDVRNLGLSWWSNVMRIKNWENIKNHSVPFRIYTFDGNSNILEKYKKHIVIDEPKK